MDCCLPCPPSLSLQVEVDSIYSLLTPVIYSPFSLSVKIGLFRKKNKRTLHFITLLIRHPTCHCLIDTVTFFFLFQIAINDNIQDGLGYHIAVNLKCSSKYKCVSGNFFTLLCANEKYNLNYCVQRV